MLMMFQLYITFSAKERSCAIQKLEGCLNDVKSWSIKNKLALNDSKTELVHFFSKYSSDVPQISVRMGQSVIEPSNIARNLGAVMDSSLSMSQNVDVICKSAFVALRKISKIRRFLTRIQPIVLSMHLSHLA